MIVKDKANTLSFANFISGKLLEVIGDESDSFKSEDDPAEYFYLLLHITAMLNAKVILALLGYSAIYGIKIIHYDNLLNIITNLSSENLKANMNKIEENNNETT